MRRGTHRSRGAKTTAHFTEVKSESEEGESDVAPTADEEETKPPPSLTHASESDEFHSAANSTDTKQNVVGVKRSGDVQDGGDTKRVKVLEYATSCAVCGRKFKNGGKNGQGQSGHYRAHVIKGKTQEERNAGARCLEVLR